jgi:hypothetical protein
MSKKSTEIRIENNRSNNKRNSARQERETIFQIAKVIHSIQEQKTIIQIPKEIQQNQVLKTIIKMPINSTEIRT